MALRETQENARAFSRKRTSPPSLLRTTWTSKHARCARVPHPMAERRGPVMPPPTHARVRVDAGMAGAASHACGHRHAGLEYEEAPSALAAFG
eukprot:28285-Pyramimonas_sp.AAC.1